MRVKLKGVTLTVAIILALTGLFLGIFASQHLSFNKKIDPAQFHGTYLEHPRSVNQFHLIGIDQLPFENSSLQGHWTLIFFGFTQCGYMCPTTMAELSKMYRMLEEKEVKNLPQVVMVSIDPQRDSLEKLNQYVKAFHKTFYGATGEEHVIKLIAQEMGIAYTKIMNKTEKNSQHYDVQHSGAVMLFNPQGELTAFFTSPHHADLLVKDYMLLVS